MSTKNVDFSRFFKEYCRNGMSPIKGIDTFFYFTIPLVRYSRNGMSPIKGIDTKRLFNLDIPQINVEMG